MLQKNRSLFDNVNFFPVLLTQFTGALHDNIFKNAFVSLLVFGVISYSGYQIKIIVTAAAGIFIFPFVVLSALGGDLAEKFDKSKVMQFLKLVEFLIIIFGVVAIYYESVVLAFTTLFLLGSHSALFGPSKYSILPERLAADNLIQANALLNSSTFLAILTGTVIGVGFINIPIIGKPLVCGCLVLCAVTGYIASRYIPSTKPLGLNQIRFNIFKSTKAMFSLLFMQKRNILLLVLGNAWFFFIGGMFLTQFPNFVKEYLHSNEQVLLLCFSIFSFGMAAGGFLNQLLLKKRIEATFVPLAAIGISIFCFDLYYSTNHITFISELRNVYEFISVAYGWRILADIFFISVMCGLFVIPLGTLIQHNTDKNIRTKIIAASGALDALFIIFSSIFSAILVMMGASIPKIFMIYGILNAGVAIYIFNLLPHYVLKSILQLLFKFIYKVEVKNIENLAKAGPRCIIISNHVSLLDAPLLFAFLPDRTIFAIDYEVAKWKWLKIFLRCVETFPIDPSNPFAIKALIAKAKEDRMIMIFPEGRLTQTSGLMKIYEGPGMIAAKSNANILSIRIDGLQHTMFSRLKNKVFYKTFPKVTITILEPINFEINSSLKGRAARKFAGQHLHHVMEQMMFTTSDIDQTIFSALVNGYQ